jgi:DNA-binding NtrC family response regulator
MPAPRFKRSRQPTPSDLVLLDMRLPDSDDLTVLSVSIQLSRLPVVLMTAHGSRRCPPTRGVGAPSLS